MREYHVALSFASEQRDYIENVAKYLKSKNIFVYYDKHDASKSWGKNKYNYFEKIYLEKACLVVLFVSKDYITKEIPLHEAESARKNPRNIVLVAKFDDSDLTKIDLDSSSLHLDIKGKSEEYTSKKIEEKLIEKGLIFGQPHYSRDYQVTCENSLEDNIEVTVVNNNGDLLTYEYAYLSDGLRGDNRTTRKPNVHVLKAPEKSSLYNIYMADHSLPGIHLQNISAGAKIKIEFKSKNLKTGSLIGSRWVDIPKFGKISPVLDNGRLYFHVDNISCEGKGPGPSYPFSFGEDLNLKDFYGKIKNIRILHGSSPSQMFLIEYLK